MKHKEKTYAQKLQFFFSIRSKPTPVVANQLVQVQRFYYLQRVLFNITSLLNACIDCIKLVVNSTAFLSNDFCLVQVNHVVKRLYVKQIYAYSETSYRTA